MGGGAGFTDLVDVAHGVERCVGAKRGVEEAFEEQVLPTSAHLSRLTHSI